MAEKKKAQKKTDGTAKSVKKKTEPKVKAKLAAPEPPAWLGRVKLSGLKLDGLDADGWIALRKLTRATYLHIAARAYLASLERYGNADGENVEAAKEDVKHTLTPEVKAVIG